MKLGEKCQRFAAETQSKSLQQRLTHEIKFKLTLIMMDKAEELIKKLCLNSPGWKGEGRGDKSQKETKSPV